MAASVLRARYCVHASESNYDNAIGVPLCLLELDPDLFEAYLDFSAYPWRNGVLAPKPAQSELQDNRW